jgi:hypothetical protein
VTHQFTKYEVQLAIQVSKDLIEHPMFMDDKTMLVISRDFSTKDEMKKTVNLLENLQHWMQRAEDAEFRLKGLDK